MCGPRLNRILLALLLLFLPLWATYSDADASCQDILDECMTRLEMTTNELESATDLLSESRTLIAEQNSLIQTQRILSVDLMTQLTERDERLKTIGSLWTEYAESRRRDVTVATIKGVGIGIGVTSTAYALFSLLF